jgi:hypothetical protein
MQDCGVVNRWFRLTPGHVVIGLLAVEVGLWLSERIGWFGWHKGYAVLTCVAVAGVAMLLMLVWFGVALIFRQRFQFSIRSLLVLTVAVAIPSSWLAVETKKAGEQEAHVRELRTLGDVIVEYELDVTPNYISLGSFPPPDQREYENSWGISSLQRSTALSYGAREPRMLRWRRF